MRISNILAYLICFLLLLGCGKKLPFIPEKTPVSRTVMVYMGGNNNLQQETFEKIAALKEGYKADMGRLLIYQAVRNNAPRLLEIVTDASGKAMEKVWKTYEMQDAANAAVFAQVLAEVKRIAPAKSYGLILFSHASGWLPEGMLLRPRTLLQDGQNELELREFAAALPDRSFDFMIFEACFMTGIEVLYELKDKTNYIMASSAEILSPGFTPIYPQLLPYLYTKEADLKGFSEHVFAYYNSLSGNYQSATISLIDVSSLTELAAWVRTNATGNLQSNDLGLIQHFDRYVNYRLFFDFEDYYQKLAPAHSYPQLSAVLDKMIVFKATTPQFLPSQNGFTIRKHSGLTTYIKQAKFPLLNIEHEKLKWKLATQND